MPSNRSAFVTGGGGYLGGRLAKQLAANGYRVTTFDVHYLEGQSDSRIDQIKGDITNSEELNEALARSDADVVFHVASYGMSGREQLNRRLIEAVNIDGTRNLIQACVKCGCTRLIYTSTYNVVFGGQEIRNGDESIPYLPLHKHVDYYSRTKSIAEQEVLQSNGQEVEGGKMLRTCAIRCAGIYGEGEQRHLPRIVSYMEKGLIFFIYGSPEGLVDFLHSDNFVQAHVKAAESMTEPKSPVPGQAYFISDGNPINNFEFFRPLFEGLGYPYPRLRIPITLVYFFAFLTELVHNFVARYIYNFQPLLTRAEVYKTGVTHYFNISRARQDFGYNPEPKTLDGVVQWFKDRGHGALTKRSQHRWIYTLIVNVVLVIAASAVLLSFLPVAS